MLDDFLDALEDLLLWLPRKLWEWLLDALAFLLESIPAPDWYQNAADIFNGSSGINFWLDLANVPEGIGIVFGAYVIRFVIRRIPLIG